MKNRKKENRKKRKTYFFLRKKKNINENRKQTNDEINGPAHPAVHAGEMAVQIARAIGSSFPEPSLPRHPLARTPLPRC